MQQPLVPWAALQSYALWDREKRKSGNETASISEKRPLASSAGHLGRGAASSGVDCVVRFPPVLTAWWVMMRLGRTKRRKKKREARLLRGNDDVTIDGWRRCSVKKYAMQQGSAGLLFCRPHHIVTYSSPIPC